MSRACSRAVRSTTSLLCNTKESLRRVCAGFAVLEDEQGVMKGRAQEGQPALQHKGEFVQGLLYWKMSRVLKGRAQEGQPALQHKGEFVQELRY